jgi:prepilin-type N-terminal cleavage/methylation domain-containing protein
MKPTEARQERSKRDGFTLVETIIAVAIAVVIMGGLIFIMIHFRRSYEKGEGTAVTLQEGILMMAMLRNDLINAVMDAKIPADQWTRAMESTPEKLKFSIYRDNQGNIEPVVYAYDMAPDGGSISRTQGTNHPKTLVNRHVASLSWNIGHDLLTGVGSGVRQIWVDLSLTLGGQGKVGTKSKKTTLRAKLFPVRMNRQFNER